MLEMINPRAHSCQPDSAGLRKDAAGEGDVEGPVTRRTTRISEASAGEELPAPPRRPESPTTLSAGRQPFLYITAALVTGILLDRWAAPPRWAEAAALIWSIAFSIKFIAGKKDAAASLALIISFAAAGAALFACERNSVSGLRLKQLFDERVITPDDPVEVTGVLVMPPEPAPGAYYLDLESEELRLPDGARPAAGRVRFMVPLADAEMASEFQSLALDYGSRVRALVRLERARSYKNPGSPDFNEFLERQGYDLKGTVKSPLLIEPLGRAPVARLPAALYHLRLALMGAIDARFAPPVAGTLKAMLVDNRYFLDRRAIERLRESSTFHVISISGMHVGMIAWALLVLGNALRLLTRRPSLDRRRTLQALVTLSVLWCYAAMVGLAPPVTRAASMISVALVGPLLFRRAASVNTVALAAFAMLVLKPALVADPGFQLSFVAVAGIVALALPFTEKLRAIGSWRPASSAPYPPRCPRAVRSVAEALFWNEREFNEEMRRAPVRYRADKGRASRLLVRLRVQPLIRGTALLAITSVAIQVSTLPLMALYFNRAAPVGILLNVAAGALTGLIMLAATLTILLAPLSLLAAGALASITTGAHALLVNSVEPFANIPGSTFRVAHYESPHSIIYALYFVPLVMLAVLIDRWRPVVRLLPADQMARARADAGPARAVRARTDGASPTGVEEVSQGGGEAPAAARGPGAYSIRLSAAPVALCLLALSACSVAVLRPAPAPAGAKLTIHFLDVGQGDSALVVFPRGATMLVDAGGEIRFGMRAEGHSEFARPGEGMPPDESGDGVESDFNDRSFSVGEAVVSRFLWSQGRTELDYVLATHADADHIDGLSDVVKNFHVGEALVGHAAAADYEFNRFASAAARRNIALGSLSAGERFDIEGVTVEVLWPPPDSGPYATSGNNDSVVLRLVYGSVAILLAGDIEQEAERALVESSADLRADVLKVAHHGSKTSSTEGFIDRVRPRCVVISAGERSRFGHPHAVVTGRYLSRGVTPLQTGRDGTITVETDGAAVAANVFRE
jgi:competence protein ComEC